MSGREGFTLMEIIIVLIIIGIAAAFALPNFTGPNNQALAQNAVNNLLAIYSAQQNYNNNNGQYCYGGNTLGATCSSLSAINSVLSLNIQDDGLYTYYCDSQPGTPPVVGCHALNSAYSTNPITVFLNGVNGRLLFPLSLNVNNANANPYSGDCNPVNSKCPL